MSTEREQSDIRECRDQISLDFADEYYLNIVSANLGINRPPFGFSDKLWRALVKTLALQYKQIRDKFNAALEVLFGPKITQVATLKTAAYGTQTVITLNEVSNLPQLGTLVLDDGLATEETVSYSFIDRYTNEVYLEDELVYDHTASDTDAEGALFFDVSPTTGTTILGLNTKDFPTAGPVTLVIGRGTVNEEVVELTSASDTGIVLSAALTNSHGGQTPTSVRSTLNTAYAAGSFYLELDSSEKFPSAGTVLLGSSSNDFTATGGTTTTAICAAATFTDSRHTGSLVVFEGNVTGGLANQVGLIKSNTATTLTFFTALPFAPVTGDRFKIRPRVYFSRNDYDDSLLYISRDIVDVTLPIATVVELLRDGETVALAPVQVQGVGWNTYQVTPKHVELFLPTALEDIADLRSASYLHTTLDGSPPSTTLSSGVSAGGTTLPLTTTVDLPIVGVVTINLGGGTEENVGYYAHQAVLVAAAAAGAVSLVVLDSSSLPSSGSLQVDIEGTPETVTVSANDIATNTLTISALGTARQVGAVVRFRTVTLATGTLANAHLAAETVDLYQPGSGYLSGDYITWPDTFPGPYVYEATELALSNSGSAKLYEILAGPTRVMVSQPNGKTALEVEDASAFPLTGFPKSILVGDGTGNRETVTLNDVNLKQRAGTTVAVMAAIGSVAIEVASLTGAGTASDFPNVNGYRVLLDRGGADEEVVYVTGTAAGPARLLLASATLRQHDVGENVELLSDVMSVSALGDVHTGIVTQAQRVTRWPSISSSARENAEQVQVLYSEIALVSAAPLPTLGEVIVNFGSVKAKVTDSLSGSHAAGSTVLTLASTTALPIIYPFTVVISPGKYLEETVHVTNNNTGTGQLTITHGTKFTHPSLEPVTFTPGTQEVLEYTSKTATAIRFSTPIVLQSNHQSSEEFMVTNTNSSPVDTGYDFPFRMPPSLEFRLSFILDLIRAAGIKVSIITKR